MNIQKIINRVETRKKVTEKYKKDLQTIFDWISGLELDCTITSKQINAKFYRYYENGAKVKDCSTDEVDGCDGKFCIYITKGKCELGIEWEWDFEEIGLSSLNYFNIDDMNTAVFSILTQLENIGTREEKANEIKKIIEAIKL
jgi:hypothetical protein